MKSTCRQQFWDAFHQLPQKVQDTARKNYELWNQNPWHPSIYFKPLTREIWSARVGIQYRAMCFREGNEVTWFWIGTHAEYDKFLSQIK